MISKKFLKICFNKVIQSFFFIIYGKIKTQNLDLKNVKIKKIKYINKTNVKKLNYKVKDFYVDNERIVVKYELKNKDILYIYDILTGKEIKKIELLK